MDRKFRIKELSSREGDVQTTTTVEEARELDFQNIITVFPDGTVVRTWDQLLQHLNEFPEDEEPLVYRFPAMEGG